MRNAAAGIEGLLTNVDEDAWSDIVEESWTAKDVVGHLTAWSDLLIDGAEALAQGDTQSIEGVDIDEWNAVQIRERRDWSVRRVQAAWQASVRRACSLAEGISTENGSRRQSVSWSDDPVSIDDVFAVWLLHIEQHRDALSRWHTKNRKQGR